MGVPGFFLYFRIFFGVLFSMRFRSPLSGGPGAKRIHFGTTGGSKFVLSPARRAIFQKIVIFMKKYVPGGGGVFWVSFLGVFFRHFSDFLDVRFSNHFWDPRGCLKNDCFVVAAGMLM